MGSQCFLLSFHKEWSWPEYFTSVQFRKFIFHLQSIQNLPFKYHQQVSQLWSKGHFPDRSHCAFLNTIRSQHSQLLAPDWAGRLLLQLIPSTAFSRVGEHLQGRSTCKVTWNCRPEAVHPNKNGEQIQQLFSGYLETRFEFMWDLICMA